MNTTTTASDSFITELTNKLVATTKNGARFIGVTYRSKSTNELARHVLNVGIDYQRCVQNSLVELESMLPTLSYDIQIEAANELTYSLKNTLQNMTLGVPNDNYKKKGVYVNVCNGLKINLNDGSFELQGLQVSKKVLEAGVYKVVNSKALTIAKNELRNQLSIGSYRTLACDVGALESVRIGGTELEVA